ncbi:hypothetical protein MHYP_G00242380 [Metynnis hypsauchen]
MQRGKAQGPPERSAAALAGLQIRFSASCSQPPNEWSPPPAPAAPPQATHAPQKSAVPQPPFHCLAGFVGLDCEVDVNACALVNVTCPVGMVCVDASEDLRYTCRRPCPHTVQPCANRGRCFLSSGASYSCVCAPGWTGPNCLVNINECAQHRCQNGATCVDEVGGYSCQCDRGYTGVHCELSIDRCLGHQCSEHSVCLGQRHNYTCRCVLGYEGVLCETETDECRSSPCANGATCVDSVANYWCLCASGFEGELCTSRSGLWVALRS